MIPVTPVINLLGWTDHICDVHPSHAPILYERSAYLTAFILDRLMLQGMVSDDEKNEDCFK